MNYPTDKHDTEQGHEGNFLSGVLLNAERQRREGVITEEEYQVVRAAVLKQKDFIQTTYPTKETSGVEIDGIIFYPKVMSVEQKRNLVLMLEQKYITDMRSKLVDILRIARQLGIEDLIDWEKLSRPRIELES